MQSRPFDADDVRSMLINPFYAITIHPDMLGGHEHLVSKEKWVEANSKLIGEMGAEAWLEGLLAVLQGDFSRTPDDKKP